MSRLEDAREKLYGKEYTEPPALPREPLPLPRDGEATKRSWQDLVVEPSEVLSELDQEQRRRRTGVKFLLILAGLVLLATAGTVGYWLYFPRGAVEFSITGPEEVIAGEFDVFTIRITNRGSVTLKDGSVTVMFPDGALLEGREVATGSFREKFTVDDVAPDGTFKRDLRVRFLGSNGQAETMSAAYLYRPENIQGELARQADFTATIVRVPVAIAVDVPERIRSGQEVAVTVGLDSESAASFPDMSVGIVLPAGFELVAANPPLAPGEELIWRLGTLEAGTSTTVVIRGIVSGEPEEVKPFHIRLGRYDATRRAWLVVTEYIGGPTISSPFLFAHTSLNGSRDRTLVPGSSVQGRVFFRNNLPEEIQNVIITASFPEQLVALESVRVEDGFYDVIKRRITWNPASARRLLELAPGAEGMLSFSFIMKAAPPIKSLTDKNFVFPVVTSIDSASPPEAYAGVLLKHEDRLEVKVESRLTVAARSTYFDAPVANAGPLPPKVRQTTTYTVFLQLASGANDLRGVEVRTRMPGGVEWRGAVRTDIGTVNFNAASQEMTWTIRELAAATGILRPQATAVVQVALTPSESAIGASPPLLAGITAAGRDAFTGTEHTASAAGPTTELRGDPKSTALQWRVAE